MVGENCPSRKILDPVSCPIQHGNKRQRALRPISPEDSRLLAVFLRGESRIQGVRNKDMRHRLYPEQSADPAQRRKDAARITRQIRLLRAHGLIYRVSRTNFYRTTQKGERVMTTAIKFRETDFALLAA